MPHNHEHAHAPEHGAPPPLTPTAAAPSLTVEVIVPYLTNFETHDEWFEGDLITATDDPHEKAFIETLIAAGRVRIASDDHTVAAGKPRRVAHAHRK